jgi:hypothetical protein
MEADAIVAYKNAPSIDVELELEALGDAFAENVLLFCRGIVGGEGASGIDHWRLMPFDEYRDVPVYKYAFNGRFALVAVEDADNGERRVSLVMAGRTGQLATIDDVDWDGSDMTVLRDKVLRPRLEDYFT